MLGTVLAHKVGGYSNSMKLSEIQDGYQAILKQVTATNSGVERIRSGIKLVFNRNLLNDYAQQLDNSAEQLHRIDEALNDIAEQRQYPESDATVSMNYLALFDLGNSVCLSLYQAYQAINRLRHRLNLYLSMTAIAALALIFWFGLGL